MQPAPNLWYKPDQVHATIEHEDYACWIVTVWTSPLTGIRSVTFTRWGARHRARRGVARERRRLARDRQAETIR